MTKPVKREAAASVTGANRKLRKESGCTDVKQQQEQFGAAKRERVSRNRVEDETRESTEASQQADFDRRLLLSNYLAVRTFLMDEGDNLLKPDSDKLSSIFNKVETLHEQGGRHSDPVTCRRRHCFVVSGCSSCHCVALDVEGRCYTWGRNEKGQLGHGDTIRRDQPTVVSELQKYKIVKAGTGRSHTVLMKDSLLHLDGINMGSLEIETVPIRCQVIEVNTTACGAEFIVWLSSVEGACILTAGLPQYGQLGHGTHNEYNTKVGPVKLAYEAQPWPKAIVALAEETIVKVACGTSHTVAVDSNGYDYTLGHKEQKEEWIPSRGDVFQRHYVLPPDAVVSAGSMNSACTAGGGQLYMWGKHKRTSDDVMYPKPLRDLRQSNVSSASNSSVCLPFASSVGGTYVAWILEAHTTLLVWIQPALVGELINTGSSDMARKDKVSEEPEKKDPAPKQTKKRGAATKARLRRPKKKHLLLRKKRKNRSKVSKSLTIRSRKRVERLLLPEEAVERAPQRLPLKLSESLLGDEPDDSRE